MKDPESWVSVARFLRPQGRRGEILAEVLTDFPERFEQMREAFLAREKDSIPTPVTIERAWLHKGRVVLKLGHIDSISAAEALRGTELVISSANRMPLDPDAAYIGDLSGCELIDLNQPGHPSIGTVQDVIQQNHTTDLLIVLGSDGREHWIPFAKAYLVRLDLPGRRLEMNLPSGLLDVNAPVTEEEHQAQQREEASAESSRDERLGRQYRNNHSERSNKSAQ